MKKFKDLTIKGQKMRIVRDAILQIEKQVVIPTQGEYFVFDEKILNGRLNNIQKILQKGKKETCQACAKGSLFASCVLNTNKVYRDDNYPKEWFQKEKLSKWFSELELDMIEAAFEKKVVEDTEGALKIINIFDETITELGEKCINFGKKYKTPKGRLLGILKNIQKYGSFLDYERKIKPKLQKEKEEDKSLLV